MVKKANAAVWMIKMADTMDYLLEPYPSIHDPKWHAKLLRKGVVYLVYGGSILQ